MRRCAVAAEQAEAFAGINLEIDVVEDGRTTKGMSDIEEAEERHKGPTRAVARRLEMLGSDFQRETARTVGAGPGQPDQHQCRSKRLWVLFFFKVCAGATKPLIAI